MRITRVAMGAAAAASMATLGIAGTASAAPHPYAHTPNPGGPHFYTGDNGAADSGGSAKAVNEGHGGQEAVLESTGYGYGLVSVDFPGHKTTFSQLANLSTSYDVTTGDCSGGSPRYQIDLLPPGDHNLSDAISFYVYFGAQPYGGCAGNTMNTQTNLIGDDSNGWWFVDSSGVSNTPENYSVVKAQYGGYQLLDVQIAVDGGWAQSGNVQQVTIQGWKVDGKTYFPAPHNAGSGGTTS